MLVEFQQALADLVASPEFCKKVRGDSGELRRRYDLSDAENTRLIAMVNQRGMECNCMLYRANRLAPLALNLHGFCTALGPRLGPLLTEYSTSFPNTNVHFYLECDRFCQFILRKIEAGYALESDTRATFDQEYSRIRLNLAASHAVL